MAFSYNPLDPQNWNKERQSIVQDILKTLRVQRDQKRELRLEGAITINPQTPAAIGGVQTYGPYYFKTAFTGTPVVTWGQQLFDPSLFFAVLPVVTQWHILNGTIDGFYMGIQPLVPVPVQLTKHIVTWQASGKGSIYKTSQRREAWQNSYQQGFAGYLTQTDTETDK